MKVLHSQG